MRAFITWYRSRPSDELCAHLKKTLSVIGAEIAGENSTIKSSQLPSMLAASLRAGDIAIIIGGMELIKEEENTVFILSKCLSFNLEKDRKSRSDYIYDTLRATPLPSIDCAMLFPSAAGGPEGVLVYSGTQLLMLLPWLDEEHMDMLDVMADYLPEIVGGPQEHKASEGADKPDVPDYVLRAAQRHHARTVTPDAEMRPDQLRLMFAEKHGQDAVMETNRAIPRGGNNASSENSQKASRRAAGAAYDRASAIPAAPERNTYGYSDDRFSDERYAENNRTSLRADDPFGVFPNDPQRRNDRPDGDRAGVHAGAPVRRSEHTMMADDPFGVFPNDSRRGVSGTADSAPFRGDRFGDFPDDFAGSAPAANAGRRPMRKYDARIEIPDEADPSVYDENGAAVGKTGFLARMAEKLFPRESMMRVALPLLVKSLSVVLVVCIITALCVIGYRSYESGLLGPKVIYQSEVAAMYGQTAADDDVPLPAGALERFSALYAENGDVGGFISIPGTDISQPVMLSTPDRPDLYSHLDFYGRSDNRGSVYFDAGNKITSDSDCFNLVVHGNTTSDGAPFSELHRYTEKDFLAEHQLINLDTLYETSQWVVFSVCYVSSDTVSEFNFTNTEFYGKYDHQIHLYNLYIRSLYYTATEVFPNERIITLVTDSDDFEGAKLLVCARKVREDEDLSYIGTNVVENDLVLMPDLWYAINDSMKPSVPKLELPTEAPVEPYTTFPTSATTAAPTTAAPTTATAAPTTAQTTTAATTAATTTTTTTATTVVTFNDSDADYTTAAPATTTTQATAAPTTLPASQSVPDMRITSNGKVVVGSAADVLATIVEAEMGEDYSMEALKAQAVAAYTFYLYSGGSAKAPNFPTKKASTASIQAADAVVGQRMVYNGINPYTPYYAISAGHTANNKDINGADLSYLSSVDCSVDESVKGYRTVKEVSAKDVAAKVKSKKGIDLTQIADKSSWFEVLERDANDLYVLKVRVGESTFKGNTLHLSILGYTCLRSPCFWIEYDSSRDMFIFTSLGYGTGVGMSQTGADAYARQGHNYVWILEHFYPGVKLKS